MIGPGYFLLLSTYVPGWQAPVDDEPAEILRADHAFRAVRLDAGKHTIAFECAPFSFRPGAWITTIAIVLLVVALAIDWRTIHPTSRVVQS